MNDVNNLDMQIRLTALQLAVTVAKETKVEYPDQGARRCAARQCKARVSLWNKRVISAEQRR